MPETPQYRVITSSVVTRTLERLPGHVRRRMLLHIESLSDNPRPTGVRALAGSRRLLRIRVGDYRMVYDVLDDERLVRILRIGHRREVYRGL